MRERGIYIHIPMCVQKCYYCDFVSYSNQFEKQEQYVNRVIEEIRDNKDILEKSNISTIYIGGGTPSSIKSEYIGEMLNEVYKICKIDEKQKGNREITIEVNPGTANREKFINYREYGINRLSIGLQTTNNVLLKEIGRVHNYQEFLDTYKMAKSIGFENINVDLMIGLPNQSISDIKDTVEKIVELNPKHISVYSLIVEEGTKIADKISNGEMCLPNDEEERNQYKYVKNILELNGYKHYEISNFAQEGFESKHNMNCWEQKEYVGFGVAAHSYINSVRYSNIESIDKYINGKSEEIKIIHEIQNKEDSQKEYMILGLRKIDGVYISKFKEKFAENPIYIFRKELEKLVEEGLVEIDLDNIRLTRKGIDFGNLVWEEFI